MLRSVAGFETTPAPTSDAGPADAIATSISVRLRPAFPNPLVSQSVFAFDLTRAQRVRIGIYDVAGHLVRMLARGDFAAGQNRATWDGTNTLGRRVAAGVYYAQLEAGSARARRPVVVVR
jgi:hypothetical protein